MAGLVVEEPYVRSRTGDPGGGGDAVVVTAHFAAVLDGVTGKTRLHFDGLPPMQAPLPVPSRSTSAGASASGKVG